MLREYSILFISILLTVCCVCVCPSHRIDPTCVFPAVSYCYDVILVPFCGARDEMRRHVESGSRAPSRRSSRSSIDQVLAIVGPLVSTPSCAPLPEAGPLSFSLSFLRRARSLFTVHCSLFIIYCVFFYTRASCCSPTAPVSGDSASRAARRLRRPFAAASCAPHCSRVSLLFIAFVCVISLICNRSVSEYVPKYSLCSSASNLGRYTRIIHSAQQTTGIRLH